MLISWKDNEISLHTDDFCIISSFNPPSIYDKLMTSKMLKIVNKRIEDLKLERVEFYCENEKVNLRLIKKQKDIAQKLK